MIDCCLLLSDGDLCLVGFSESLHFFLSAIISTFTPFRSVYMICVQCFVYVCLILCSFPTIVPIFLVQALVVIV